MRPSQNQPPPPFPEYTSLSTTICNPPRSYPPLRICPPLSTTTYNMRYSQNLPLHLRIYPHFQQLYATLPEFTLPSKNISPFFDNYMRPSENQPLPPILYNFKINRRPQNIFLSQNMPPPSDFSNYVLYTQNPPPPRIYPVFNNYMIPSQNLPLPPSQNIHTPFNNDMRPSQY